MMMLSSSDWIKKVKCECADDVEKTMCDKLSFNDRVFRCSTCGNIYSYIIDEDGNEKIVKVTGVGVVVQCDPCLQGETKDNNVDKEKLYAFFEDNRVVLSKKEKEEIGDSQPYMLRPRTYQNNLMRINTKEQLTDEELGEMIYKRKNKCDEVPNDFTEEDAYKLVKKARDYYNRFSKATVCIGPDLCFSRHMIDFIFRERLEKTVEGGDGEMVYEDIISALERLLSEELSRKFRSGAARDKYKENFAWIYNRQGSKNCTLNWVIDLKDTTVDMVSVEKRLQCSRYFCAKKLPEICENKYNETRNIKFLKIAEIQKRMSAFQTCFANCDLSRWSGPAGLQAFLK